MTAPTPSDSADPLSLPFDPLATREAVCKLRDSLDLTKNTSLIGFYAFLTLGRDEMVEIMRGMYKEEGEEAVFEIIEAITSVRENFEAILKFVKMVEARTFVTAHVALDVPWDRSDPDPSPWDETLARYEAALSAEQAYDAEHILAFIPADAPPGPERSAACAKIADGVWAESTRLGDVRHDIEDELFAVPSPDLHAFARKVVICRAGGRDLNGLDDMLVAEAHGFLAGDAA